MNGEEKQEKAQGAVDRQKEQGEAQLEEQPVDGAIGEEQKASSPEDQPVDGVHATEQEEAPLLEQPVGEVRVHEPGSRQPDAPSEAVKEAAEQPAAEKPAEGNGADAIAKPPGAAPSTPPAVAADPAVTPAVEPAASAAVEGESAPVRRKETDEEKAARRKAAFEAREAAKVAAAQAAARPAPPATDATGSVGAAPAGQDNAAAPDEAPPPPPPSPSQPRLDRAVQLLRELVAPDAVIEASINEPNDHLPTLVIAGSHWLQAAKLFRTHAELQTDYLRNVSGVDHESHMEVVYHLLNMRSGHNYCVKVHADRENPSVPSVTPIWETANWNEREIYDLLGIDFPGHHDLRRIMMPDDWDGHPLRKDYVPLDPEV